MQPLLARSGTPEYLALCDRSLLLQVVLKKLVVGAQIGVAVMMFAGDKVLNALKISDPQATDFLVRMKERKFPVLMGTWIVGNMVQNALSSTGAFEVFSAGEKVCPSTNPCSLVPGRLL